MIRIFPSRLEERALTIGADNLIDLLEWLYRADAEKLRRLRNGYRRFCVSMLREFEQSHS